MLPNLAALRLSEPPKDVSDVDVGLEDLPSDVLGKVLKDTGSARALCDTVDKLERASKTTRLGAETWQEVASQYGMPGAPAQNTAVGWREHVRGWCEKISPGFDVNGYALVKLATDQAVWLNDSVGYAWILSVVDIPLSTIRGDLSIVARNHDNVSFFETAYGRFKPGHVSTIENVKIPYLSLAIENGNGAVAMWLLDKLLEEAKDTYYEEGEEYDVLNKKLRTQLVGKIVTRAWGALMTSFELALAPVLDKLESLRVASAATTKSTDLFRAARAPSGFEFNLMQTALYNDDLAAMRWLKSRYVYTPESLERVGMARSPETQALLDEWMGQAGGDGE